MRLASIPGVAHLLSGFCFQREREHCPSPQAAKMEAQLASLGGERDRLQERSAQLETEVRLLPSPGPTCTFWWPVLLLSPVSTCTIRWPAPGA